MSRSGPLLVLVAGACRVAAAPCPDGMVPGPGEPVPWCIDRYEAVVEALPGATPVARSRGGVLPTVGLSWDDAFAACAAAPVVDPVTGAVVGAKHLATAAEWEDAGDGVPGPGGPRFPWGDDPDPARCALAPEAGPAPGAALTPTGSHPRCVGPTGALDLLGNAWEWVDSGRRMDVEAWDRAAPFVTFDGDRLLAADPNHVRALTLTVPDARGAVELLPTGEVAFAGSVPGEAEVRGYLVDEPVPALPARQLPVRVAPDPGAPGHYRLRVDRALDGHVFPEKRGGAWYAGHDVDLDTRSFAHAPDFGGTIGFRCAGPPLAAAQGAPLQR